MVIIIIATFYVLFLFLMLLAFDLRYRKKYKEFTESISKNYIDLVEQVKQQAIIDALNINRQKELNKSCPYCGRKYD